MLPVWDLTVPTATKRSRAISALVRPEARSASTSSSRSLKGSSSCCAPSRGGAPSLSDSISEGVESLPGSSRRSRRAPSTTRSSRWPLRASPSRIFDASSTVSEVRITAVVGVSSPRSARASRSSRSLTFPSSGLSSAASAIGVAIPQTRASHQKFVRGARRMHIQPRTKTYRADCQLIHDGTSRFEADPCTPVPRLAATFKDRSSSPNCGLSEATSRRPGSCSRPPSSVLEPRSRSSPSKSPHYSAASTMSSRCTCPGGQLFHKLVGGWCSGLLDAWATRLLEELLEVVLEVFGGDRAVGGVGDGLLAEVVEGEGAGRGEPAAAGMLQDQPHQFQGDFGLALALLHTVPP